MGTWTPGPGATSGDDAFTGDGISEIADGLAGNDTLNGGGGADTLTGGLGDDDVFGGAGDDILVINAGDDTFGETYSGGADTDTIRLVANHPTIQSFDLYNDTLSSIERIEFTALPGAGGTNWAFLAPEQLGGGGISTTAQIAGSDLNDLLGFIMFGTVGYNLNLSGLTFSNWSATDSIGVQGADGNDVFVGSSVIDQMSGFSGADTMSGNAGNDTLSGGNDNDSLDGGADSDTLYGEDGNDILYGRAGDDSLQGGAGADTMYGGDGHDSYYIDNVGDIVVENAGPAGGDDSVYTIFTHTLGAYFEYLNLSGDQAINGFGNDLNNTLSGNLAANILNGRIGDDVLFGASGNDTLYGGDGADVIFGENDADLLDGGNSDDTLIGGAGNDTLYGRAGADTLEGVTGADAMYGGAGDDIYWVDDAGDIVGESAGGGTDRVNSSVNYALGAYVENLTLLSAATTGTGNVLGNTITGNINANTLSGLGGADTINAGGGADTVYGGDGDDIVYGGALNDTLDGGNDADQLYGDDGDDVVYGRGGNDVVTGGIGIDSLYAGDGDDYIFAGGGADLGEGGNGADRIYGEEDNDILYGRNGDDRIDGGAGADTLYGGNDADTFIFASTLGISVDVIGDFNVAQDTIELDNSFFGLGSSGTLSADAFHIGAAAADANDRIIYDPATGALYFDADGNGGGAAIQFATLATGLALTNADFVGGP